MGKEPQAENEADHEVDFTESLMQSVYNRPVVSIEAQALDAIYSMELLEALHARLSSTQKEIFHRRLRGQTKEAIADEMGCHRSNVDYHLMIIRRRYNELQDSLVRESFRPIFKQNRPFAV